MKGIMDTPVFYYDYNVTEAFRHIAMVHNEWQEERCAAAVKRLCKSNGGVVLTPREVVSYAHELAKEIWPWY